MIAAYPRKGTITVDVSSECILHERIAAYPRKGTITTFAIAFLSLRLIAAYPRKGAKTNSILISD